MIESLNIGPWPLGIDNIQNSIHSVFQVSEQGSRLIEATDVDILSDGFIASRKGTEVVQGVTAGEGLFVANGRMLHQDNGVLYLTETATPLVNGLIRRATVVEHAGLTFISDGVTHREYDGVQVRNWGLPVPVVILGTTTGNLMAGTYLVEVSFSDARGNEGGTSRTYTIVLNGAQNITVDVSNVTTDTTHVNVYVSRSTTTRPQFVAQVVIGNLPYTVTGVSVAESDPPRTKEMSGPWGEITGACSFRAFLLIWRYNVVVRSEAQEPHLFHGDSIYQFPQDVTVVAGLLEGFWVGTEGGLWWVSGADPSQWIPVQRTHDPVFSGTLILPSWKLRGTEQTNLAAVFVTERGLVAGMANGMVVPLTYKRYTFSSGSRASFAFVEKEGLEQILIAVS